MNIHSVLSRLGIEDYTEKRDEILANCIFCGDTKRNFQLNYIKKLYHCWVCNDGGSLNTLISKITGIQREDVTRLFDLDEVDVEKNIELILNIIESSKQKVYNYEQFKIGGRFKWWQQLRNINKSIVEEFDLGLDKITNRLVIPLITGGICVGLSRRAMYADQRPKYLNTTGMNNREFLFGYNNLNMKKQYVVLTEGCIDAINIRQYGYNSIALMGAYISGKNAERVAGDFDKIMLMLDNDEKGIEATQEISEILHKLGTDVYKISYSADDPGSIVSSDQFKSYEKISLI